jgi:glutathione peroxidase
MEISMSDLYSLPVRTLAGKDTDLSAYKGHVLLIVNTASQCGFTPHYAGLETLYRQHKDQGLVVLGFPCNQFGAQEPGSAADIAAFCEKNYGVSFPLMSKSVVLKTKEQNPVYSWLTSSNFNGWCNQAPAWNFCKYLINEQGVLTHYFPMSVDPLDASIIEAIKK